MIKTTVKFYQNERAMNRGIKKMEAKGWRVISTETVDRGYSCFKTGCLGLIFLPLALLGKRPSLHKVTYQRET